MLSNKFFSDKVILLMSFILGLMVTFNVLSVMLRTDLSQSATILQFWFRDGATDTLNQSPGQLYSFAIFAIIAGLLSLAFSFKLYEVYKPASYGVLALTMFTILLNVIVSGAILNLQQ